MALQDLLSLSDSYNKQGISEERLTAVVPVLRQYVSFWREYPDMFVDFMAGPNSSFKLYSYQRIFLRAALRHKYMFATYPRAYSKSFIGVMSMMIKCILYPRAKLFVSAGGKSQAAGIIKEKVDEICMLIPAFERELDRKKCKENKDYVIYVFRNGSWFDNIAANERSRGKRRQSAIFEECVSIDGDVLSSILLPILNVSRTCMDGTRQDDELLNQSQLFITTAGWKNTFSYDKLMQLLVWSIVYPDKAFVTGGSYKIPVLFGLLSKNFASELQQDATFNEAAFDREYNSYWAGSGDSAYFKGEVFDRNRKLLYAEYEYSQKQGYRGSYYILGIDIGRTMDMTVVTVLKVNPQATGFPVINVCNIYTYENLHIEDQILVFRKLHALYKPEALVVDGNGIGINYIDLMTRPQTDPDTGETYPGLGVINDPENKFKHREDEDVIDNVIYRVVANSAFNTEMYGNMQALLNSNKVKFLIPSRDAKARLLATYRGQRMSTKARNRFLVPYNMTDILKEELLNLRETTEGFNIRLERVNKHIHKDKVSSLGYALWYVKYMVEELKKKRKKFKASDWLFLN